LPPDLAGTILPVSVKKDFLGMATALQAIATINGRQVSLAWNFGAMCEAEKVFKAMPGTREFLRKTAEYADKNGMLRFQQVLGYCMLQQLDPPVRLIELEQLASKEALEFVQAVMQATGLGASGPFRAKKKDGAAPLAKGVALSGTGEKRSRKRSSVSALRRRSSSGSRRSSSS
jgi:hypothetical protein